MSARTDPEELLRLALTGDEEAAEAVGRDPELAARFAALRAVQRRLEAGSVQESVLAEARGERWPEGEARLEAVLRGEAGGAQRPPRFRPFLTLLAAVAAVALVVVLVSRDESPPAPIFLGAELPGARPAGPVEEYLPFTWDLPQPPGWTVEIRVYDAREGAPPAPLAEADGLRSSPWSPDPAATRAWPDAIRWTLTLVGPDGTIADTYSVRAERSPR